MSEIPEGSYPDCPVANCPQAVVVWRDGKRYFEHRGDYEPFDSFVRLALHEILGDLEGMKAQLDRIERLQGNLAP